VAITAFVEIGSSDYAIRLNNALSRGDAITVRIARDGYGVDISGHRPEDLRTVDMFLGESFRNSVTQNSRRYAGAVMAIGSYVGEVFVRNLAGWWRFPDTFQMIVLFLSWNPWKRGERYCHVVVREQQIQVFKAVREGIQRTSKEFSLYDFYQRWARYFQS